jgi:hypothetical protein
VVVDDLHLPERNAYGVQPAQETLRLLLDRQGLYQQ